MPSLDQEDGKEMLEALERGNLFVIPLDDQRQWYRYHHLFADVLQAHLREAQPDQVSDAAPAGERLVRAERSAGRCDPPCAGRQGFRASGGLDRTGLAGDGPQLPVRHVAWLGEGAARRSDPRHGRWSAWAMPGRC